VLDSIYPRVYTTGVLIKVIKKKCMQRINQMPYLVRESVVGQIEKLETYKAIEDKLQWAELNLEDVDVSPTVEARHDVYEDDGFVHVNRGHLHFSEYLGQERKILKRDIKAVEREIDLFIESLEDDLFAQLNTEAWGIVSKVEMAADLIMRQQKAIDEAVEAVDKARAAKNSAERKLHELVYEAINGDKPFESLDRPGLMMHLFNEFEVKGDKAKAAFNKAWEIGHSNGNHEVRNEFLDLVELLK